MNKTQKLIAGTGIVGLVTFLLTGTAGAQDASVTAAFADGESALMSYIAVGIGVIVTVLLAGLGVGLLVKYLRRAVRSA